MNGSDHQLLPLPQPPQQQQTRTGSHAPLHPRPVLGPLISRPPQDDKLRNYYAEVEGWVRPMWLPEQLAMVPNYLSSQAVVTNLRNVMYGLDGSVPSPGDWKMWCADRLAVVKGKLGFLLPIRAGSQLTFRSLTQTFSTLARPGDNNWTSTNDLRSPFSRSAGPLSPYASPTCAGKLLNSCRSEWKR